MEMFVLSYVNELCIYLRLLVKLVPPKTQNQLDKPVCFTHANVLLSYVNETVFARKLPFFKILVNHFTAQDNSPCANVISKMHDVGEGPGVTLSFDTFPFSN